MATACESHADREACVDPAGVAPGNVEDVHVAVRLRELSRPHRAATVPSSGASEQDGGRRIGKVGLQLGDEGLCFGSCVRASVLANLGSLSFRCVKPYLGLLGHVDVGGVLRMAFRELLGRAHVNVDVVVCCRAGEHPPRVIHADRGDIGVHAMARQRDGKTQERECDRHASHRSFVRACVLGFSACLCVRACRVALGAVCAGGGCSACKKVTSPLFDSLSSVVGR